MEQKPKQCEGDTIRKELKEREGEKEKTSQSSLNKRS